MSLCNNGLLNCIFGECNNNNTCICSEGYKNDQFWMNYTNCALPLYGIQIYGSITLLSCLLACLGNIYVCRYHTRKGSLLRYLSIYASLTNLFFSCLVIDLVISNIMRYESIVFLVLAIVTSCITFSYLFLSILKPVSRISSKIAVKFIPWKRFWLYILPTIVFCGIVIVLFGAYFIANNNTQEFNTWISGQALIFVFVVIIAVPSFTSFTGILMKGLIAALNVGNRMEEENVNNSENHAAGDENRLSSSQPASPVRLSSARFRKGSSNLNNNNEPDFGAAMSQKQLLVKELLEKVIFIRRFVFIGGIFLFSLSTISFSFQVITGTIPFYWAIFLTGPFGISLFSLQVAFYIKKKRENENRRSTLAPFLAEVGKQLSKSNRNIRRLSGFFHSKQSDGVGEKLTVNTTPEYVEPMKNLEVPTTVKEEASKDVNPNEFSGSWGEARNHISVVRFEQDQSQVVTRIVD